MLTPPYALPGPDDRSPNAADFLVRWQAQLLVGHRRSGLGGAEGIRSDLELAPHQARTVLEVLSAPRVRHVLADEVGMGKTIEALMVYQALRLERPSLRTYVLVPGHLTYQWLGEIYLRAHRVFAIATRGREDALELSSDLLLDREWLTGKNGEEARERLVASLGGELLPAPRLLIVDEAHRLSKAGYQLVQDMARRVDHVLLLTATPVELEAKRTGKRGDQLKYEELLRLLDPDLTARELDASREREARTIELFVAPPRAAPARAAWCRSLAQAAGDDARARALAERAASGGDDAETDLLDYVAARGLAAWRVLRHRRADAPRIFKRRVLGRHVVPALPGFEDALALAEKAIRDLAASPAAPFAQEPGWRERALEDLAWRASVSVERAAEVVEDVTKECRELAPQALESAPGRALARVHETLLSVAKEEDPKLVRLRELVAQAWAEDRKAARKTLRKFLVFVSDRESLERAKHFLELELATDVAVFHAGLDNTLRDDGEPPERLQQLLDFRNKATTSILLCTDIAAEGHNLHSACHTVVLYDLPRNPNTTEQRIGRIDRLGQSREVTIHVLLLEGTTGPAQADRQAALGVFERSLGALAPSEEEALHAGKTLEKESRRDLTSPLRSYRNQPSPELGDRLRAGLERPAGWVFRAASRFGEWYGEAELFQACLGSALTRAALRAFDLKAEKNEQPPPRVRESLRFRLGRGGERIPGYRDTWGSFDRDEALEQDQLQFFASGHPFVEDVLGRATSGGARQALRYRLPGQGPRKGLLLHFLWDPAMGLRDASDTAARIARAALPVLSVPVVVSAGLDKKLAVEVGPPNKTDRSLRRDLLQALVELDPNVCESALEDPIGEEEVAAWTDLGRQAALEWATKALAGKPGPFEARLLRRAAGEIDRDATLPARDELAALVEREIPELLSARVGDALVLDALATFEMADMRAVKT